MSKNSAYPRRVITLPQLADARARKSLAERLQCFGFTEEAARCIADATVDPAAARKFIGEPESPNYEVRRTPIGIVKGIPVEVWSSRVMPDPRNPRTSPEKKHPFAVDPGTGDSSRRFAPIADPKSADLPGTPELTVTIENVEHIAHAHSQAAEYIFRHNPWEDSIRSQGVMEPIWLAVTKYRHLDGTGDAIALTTVDGSSRLTAVHHILQDKTASFLKFRSANVPYRGEDDAKFRADIRRMNEWIETESLDESSSAVLRNCIVPAFIIVGFESERSDTTFHTAVKSLVALRHVDPPKPWGAGPEHESLADEVLDQLDVAGLITSAEAAYLRGSLTREQAMKANFSPDPAIRAARIIDVFLKRDEEYISAIRVAVTAQSTRKQSSPKLMKELATALILRGLDLSPSDAEQKRKHLTRSIPAAAERRGNSGIDWQATDKPRDRLIADALDEHSEAKRLGRDEPGPATIELAVRSILPLVASGTLTGGSNFNRDEVVDRREPSSVIDAMRKTERGLRQLDGVLRDFGDGKKYFNAVDFRAKDLDGDQGETIRIDDTYLRTEYPDPGKMPVPKATGDQPLDIYKRRIHEFQTAIESLQNASDRIKACRDSGRLLAETRGIDYRSCKMWGDVIQSIAKDLAIWEKADQDYNGPRIGPDEEMEDVIDSAYEDFEDEEDDDQSGS